MDIMPSFIIACALAFIVCCLLTLSVLAFIYGAALSRAKAEREEQEQAERGGK